MKKLLTLVIAGVAIKYFLDTDKGKQVLSQVKDWLAEAQDAFNEGAETAGNNTKRITKDVSSQISDIDR